MNNKVILKLYAIVSITLVLVLFVEAFLREKIINLLLIKIIDYFFWFVFGFFSAFFILRRLINYLERKNNDKYFNLN